MKMYKVRFLFYRAKFEWRNFLKTRRIRLVDDAISWWSWPWNIGTGPYAHVEVWLPDKTGNYSHTDKWVGFSWLDRTIYTGTCYTSTLRDNYRGTCKRPASQVLKHPERWDYMEFDVPEDLYYAMKAWMETQVENNKGYDKKAIISFFWPKRFHNADKFICSEFCQIAAVYAGILHLPYQVVSPRKLSRMLLGKMQRIK